MTIVPVTSSLVERVASQPLPIVPATLQFQGPKELNAFNSSFATLVLQPPGM